MLMPLADDFLMITRFFIIFSRRFHAYADIAAFFHAYYFDIAYFLRFRRFRCAYAMFFFALLFMLSRYFLLLSA